MKLKDLQEDHKRAMVSAAIPEMCCANAYEHLRRLIPFHARSSSINKVLLVFTSSQRSASIS